MIQQAHKYWQDRAEEQLADYIWFLRNQYLEPARAARQTVREAFENLR